MQITICGGGNAAHTLAGLITARQDFKVNVYAPLNDEVQHWRQGIAAQGGISVVSYEGALRASQRYGFEELEEVIRRP